MERLGVGSLISKADWQEYSWYFRAIGSQFTNEDNYTCSLRWYIMPFDSSSEFTLQRFESITFNGSTTNSLQHQELEFCVQVMEYGTNTVFFESDWYPVNTIVQIAARPQGIDERLNSYKILVRRSDGSQLNRLDLQGCVSTVFGRIYQDVEQQTLPADWFETTTIAVDNPLSTATTVIDESQYSLDVDTDPFLTLPVAISNGIHLLLTPIGIILDLKYVTFFVCFCLVCFIVAWLLH